MKMTNDDFARIVKDKCESIARVLERHAEEVTCKKEMESYRSMAQGKLGGIIDTAICVYACELGGNNEEFWAKVHEIRAYEEEIDSKITKIFLSWYDKYLNEFSED